MTAALACLNPCYCRKWSVSLNSFSDSPRRKRLIMTCRECSLLLVDRSTSENIKYHRGSANFTENHDLASCTSQKRRMLYATSQLKTSQIWCHCKPGFSLLVAVHFNIGHCLRVLLCVCPQKQNPLGVGVRGLLSATLRVLVSLAKESSKLDAVDDNSLILLGPFNMESSKVRIADMSR